VTVALEAPLPSPDVYVDMGPVEPSHYQGLLELRQGLQQEQQQQDEQEEEPAFFMDAVSTLSIPATCILLSLYPYKQPLFQLCIGKIFRRKKMKLVWILKCLLNLLEK
jgi:hypothetical protein